MKKIISLLFVSLISFVTFAESGYGTCRVPNTSDYLEASVDLNSGTITISNSSNVTVVSAYVRITATEICSTNAEFDLTIFDDRVFTIPARDNKVIKISVPTRCSRVINWRNVKVSIENPNCK